MDDPDALDLELDAYVEEQREHRKALAEAKFKLGNESDKTILTIASAALVFSISFSPSPVSSDTDWGWLLPLGWGLLLASITLVVISYETSVRSMEGQIRSIDKWIMKPWEQPLGPDYERRSKRLKSGRRPVTEWLNSLARALLVLGLIALATFTGMAFN